MKLLNRTLLTALSILLVSAPALASSAEFSQADLEKLVAELDKVIPENTHFKYPIKCTLVSKNDVNAYAHVEKEGSDYRAAMVVFSGLVKQAKGDVKTIRAVVAHELSHLSRGHLLDTDPSARDVRNLWTRQQEFEADKYGAEALVKAGYAKKDMVDMLLFLDRDQGRDGAWLENLTADHADPKARAAELAENPTALKAVVTFDTALAYEDARNHLYAKKLFEYAVVQWPDLKEAYINAGKCGLLFFYDNLPQAVRASWWRPDFGPLITNIHAAIPQATEVTDEDRERWKDAFTAATLAVTKNPDSVTAQELLALAQVLEPDAKKDVVQAGIDWFEKSQKSADKVTALRYANNAGVGYQRTGDLSKAYHAILTAQKSAGIFNSALGENLGLVKVTGRSKDDDTLAANVLYTWLSNTPPASPRWNTVKKTFDDICVTAGISAKAITQKPGVLCKVTTLVTSSKELGILLPVSGVIASIGAPEKQVSFAEKWPDLLEIRWHNELLTIWTEREKVMRITSYEAGAYLQLKPLDKASDTLYKVAVGMSKADLFAILSESSGVQKNLARGGKLDSWTYFPDLNMGVLIENDKVKAITVTPVVYEG